MSIIKDFQGCTAMLITDPYNMRYISGFRGGEGALYISATQEVLITDSRYIDQANRESDFQVIEESNAHPRNQILKECIERETAAGKSAAGKAGAGEPAAERFIMGYEDEDMRCAAFNKLCDELPVDVWKPLGESVNQLRCIKSAEEIEYLARAEAIGDIAFSKLLPRLKAGMTELEVAAILEYEMKMAGAEGLSFSSIVASGYHSAMPHAIPDEKVLEEGDFVTMDFGCLYKGYCSDMTRTVVIGKASEKQKEIYNTVLKAQLESLEAIRPGRKGKEVDKVARDIITEAGYGDYFGHGLGHSVGLFIHEDPRLAPTGETVLEEGMILTVEPGIYLPGFGGVRIEDMVVVTSDGYRNLASSPKELIEI